MKLFPYLIASLILVAGSYFTYTIYLSHNQINTLNKEKVLSLNSSSDNQVINSENKSDLDINKTSTNQNKVDEKINFPKVDILKVDPDGSFIIAGKAKPNTKINLLEKGSIIESAKVDDSGSWAIISKENLGTGDNLLTLGQSNPDGTLTQSKEIYITKIDEKNFSKPIVIEIPNSEAGKISILQTPSLNNSDLENNTDINLAKKSKIKNETFKIFSISFNEKGHLSIQGVANYGKSIDVLINDKSNYNVILDETSPNWVFNSDYKLKFGMHKLVATLKSEKNILSKIEMPFMRSEMPSSDFPENFILIKPGDMLWTISYRLYGNPLKYIEIYKENQDQITNPDLIFPGQVFTLPKEN
tara:strand:+ start:176 stop:1249 length:1074 start_codon:yes stop_codon:yes gene_type:complete